MTARDIEHIRGVQGLTLARAAVDKDAAGNIIAKLRAQEWARWDYWRTFYRQDFGFKYDIVSRDISPTTPIPKEITALFPALRAAGWRGPDPVQVIVTRYPVGGSLGAHIDAPAFGPEIAGISLETEWPIVFSRGLQGPQEHIPLPVLSAYVMRGRARTDWFHQVPKTITANERISLTFRTLAATTDREVVQGPREGRRRPSTAVQRQPGLLLPEIEQA